MNRAPLQVLVIPYRNAGSHYVFAVLRRRDEGYWQWIAGGAAVGETAYEAASREMCEEAGIAPDTPLLSLESSSTIPAYHFADHDKWGSEVLVVPERSFAVRVPDESLVLSCEHTEYRWVDCATAISLLRWDSNRTALWELNERLRRASCVSLTSMTSFASVSHLRPLCFKAGL
jgi:dATP pyrophosphohydrolase